MRSTESEKHGACIQSAYLLSQRCSHVPYASVLVHVNALASPIPRIVSWGKDKARSNYCNLWSKLEQCPRQIESRRRIAAHLMIRGNLRMPERVVPGEGRNHIATLFFFTFASKNDWESITGTHYVFIYESASWTPSELQHVMYDSLLSHTVGGGLVYTVISQDKIVIMLKWQWEQTRGRSSLAQVWGTNWVTDKFQFQCLLFTMTFCQ